MYYHRNIIALKKLLPSLPVIAQRIKGFHNSKRIEAESSVHFSCKEKGAERISRSRLSSLSVVKPDTNPQPPVSQWSDLLLWWQFKGYKGFPFFAALSDYLLPVNSESDKHLWKNRLHTQPWFQNRSNSFASMRKSRVPYPGQSSSPDSPSPTPLAARLWIPPKVKVKKHVYSLESRGLAEPQQEASFRLGAVPLGDSDDWPTSRKHKKTSVNYFR